MANKVLLCTDGSELASHALARGLAIVGADAEVVLATAAEEPDPTLVTGAGMAGGVMTGEEFDQTVVEMQEGAQADLDRARAELGLPESTELVVLRGEPAMAICVYAQQHGIDAIVMGSHGRGGVRRAVLGSVSDHVIRHAPCPVVVTVPQAATDDD